MIRIALAGLAFSSLAAPFSAQLIDDTLIGDINGDAALVGSYSGGFASDGNFAYFRAIDAVSNESFRFWRTDGTPAGTVQLTSIAMTHEESAFEPGGDLVFLADELGIGIALWRTDGTAAGTTELLAPTEWVFAAPYDLTIFDGDAWFLAGTANEGIEVWRTDLVTGTTALEFELVAGPTSGAGRLFAGGGHLYIVSPDQTELWSSDGTAGSLTQVASFVNVSSGFGNFAEAGSHVIFSIGGFGAVAGWWSSDGSAAGTVQLANTFNAHWVAEGDTKVYFPAGPQNGDVRLFETDGTLAGTLPVNFGGSSGGQVVGFEAGATIGDELFYSGSVPGSGFEPCRTTGAAAGGTLIDDVRFGLGSSDPSDFVSFDGAVYFRAEDGITGREIWKHELAGSGAALVDDLFPGPFAGIVGSSPTILATANGVVFGQNFPGAGIEPGVTDGVSSGLLLNIGIDGTSDGSDPDSFLRLGDIVLFQAFDEVVGNELFKTDGTEAGTELVADIDPINGGFPGAFGSFPHHLIQHGDEAFFFAFDSNFGSELWKSDGTEAGTMMVADVLPGLGSGEPLFSDAPVSLGDEVFFIARRPSGSLALFKTDGTAAGTEIVGVTDPAGFLTEFVRLERVGDQLIFQLNDPGVTGVELWTSDGTLAGTEILVDANPGENGIFLSEFVVAEDLGYYTIGIGANRSLWVTDGTPAGTEMLVESSSFFSPSGIAPFGSGLLFTMEDATFGREPWITDGTVAGTEVLLDIVAGPDSSRALGFTEARNVAYFVLETPTGSNHFTQLWSTDGTGAGTAMVAELPSPQAQGGIGITWVPGADDTVVFTNVDDNGREWWISDGTAVGTEPLTDIAPGPQSSSPRIGALVGNKLVFAADDGTTGNRELHAVALAATGSFGVTSLGAGCVGSNGTPALSLQSGDVALGSPFTLGVESAFPTSAALWFFDLGFGALPPLGACVPQIASPTFIASTATDGTGASSLPLAVSGGPAIVGAVVDVQVLSFEPGGPLAGLGALSDVLELVVGG